MIKNKRLKKSKLKAFSLNEVLIVLVIIGIGSTIAIVSFGDFVSEAYRKEAEINLHSIKMRQDKYRLDHFEFTTDLKKIRFEAPKKEAEGGTSVYSYEILEADKNSFVAQAKADKDYDGDGTFEVLTINQDGNIEVKIED